MNKKSLIISSVSIVLLSSALFVSANHSWGTYHWARTQNPFTLKLGDNVSINWDSYLSNASLDWSQSDVLDTAVVAGQARTNCRATAGKIEVCNKKYGNNGWLGLAQIWVSGDHITQATTKLNDTYFNTPTYNTPGWKSLVMCQEIGHNFGLDHQDEDFNNSPIIPHTCMDYFTPDANEIVHPNQHNYDQLSTIYSHLDSNTTIKSSDPKARNGEINLEDPSEWGKAISQDTKGRDNEFEKDLGNGKKLITHVFWVK
ncbi:MAG: hypothetical protein A3D35_01235 [Candidatus Staskawiczbacteria bacterium RIFCSPHIGHO2_02_FULL_34_9]|uniref:Peptidase M10 metallopeptidase domain-containing protein n=1 Tax=Candidatus Staskawiczbacteria bacterium RIFCSPHIGHO2_02_FULL_34_9 TaxID=1802206 RepID=A0A1G2I1S6_9BACT|nr:MAG: hypothetical protein A3D35_01235 [Candidatus Staskawiczbacteria bacterium RIFCSPHIGHO2_02_FULL_34_9]